MNYIEQQHYLRDNRVWGVVSCTSVMVMAAACFGAAGNVTAWVAFPCGLVILALTVSLFYVPDYLHLTVNGRKRLNWEVLIRWRLCGAGLAIGLFYISNARVVVADLLAIAFLALANYVARAKISPPYVSLHFWLTDFTLLAALASATESHPLLGCVLVAAAAHLSLIACDRDHFRWTCVVCTSGSLLLLFWTARQGASLEFLAASICSLTVVAAGTVLLVVRARRHSAGNVRAEIQELMEFTGYSEEQIRQLWSTSNQQLAKNWESAGIAENNGEHMAEWYRENSRLYLFAISAYNLEYKRIRSNLKVLKFARGSCLDYGAGDGELILELARRGHAAAYFDVEGETMKFARQRVQRHNVKVDFFRSKEELAGKTRTGGYDTIFSLDVLEHLPDLPGELDFLSSLLNPGGRMVFDVPAGSTKSHPMHLNHNLDVRAHLMARGLQEERGLFTRIPFIKQEKYVFRARE